MEIIAAGPGHYVYVRSGVATVARVVCRGLNLELLNRIRVGNRDAGVKTIVRGTIVAGRIVDGDTVHLEIVLFRIRSVHAHVERSLTVGNAICRVDRDTGRHPENSRKVPGG